MVLVIRCMPAGVICEIVNDDGSMSRTPELLKFANEHGLACITIADLVRARTHHAPHNTGRIREYDKVYVNLGRFDSLRALGRLVPWGSSASPPL